VHKLVIKWNVFGNVYVMLQYLPGAVSFYFAHNIRKWAKASSL